MDPRRYIVVLVFLINLPWHISLASGTTISVCQKIQEGQISCSQKLSRIIPQGMTESLNISVDITKQKMVFRCGLQKNDETELLIGNEKIHSLNNNTRVSLVKHNFTLMNVTKANEGLYIFKEMIGDKCWTQINVTVPDLPTSPDITNLPNISTFVTPTWSPPETNIMYIVIGIATILLFVGIVCYNASSNSSPEEVV